MIHIFAGTKTESMEIFIESAKDGNQIAIIDGKKYEFEFSEKELSEDLSTHCCISDLKNRSGLTDEYNRRDMAEIISCEWHHEDVVCLIKDFIFLAPENLPDYLID